MTDKQAHFRLVFSQLLKDERFGKCLLNDCMEFPLINESAASKLLSRWIREGQKVEAMIAAVALMRLYPSLGSRSRKQVVSELLPTLKQGKKVWNREAAAYALQHSCSRHVIAVLEELATDVRVSNGLRGIAKEARRQWRR